MLKESGFKNKMYIGNKASEETLKNEAGGTILHIATHGFFYENEDTSFASATTFKNNPLHRSGLLFKEANALFTENSSVPAGQEDGKLTAYEAMNMSFSTTDLVVLSACETGLGDVKNGEGVYGLQRSFLVSGAQSLIISFWKVDDKATNHFMSIFYKKYLKSGDKEEAFKLAMLSTKQKYEHPYYWAAFSMMR